MWMPNHGPTVAIAAGMNTIKVSISTMRNMLRCILKFEKRDYFETDEASREVPKVQF